MVCRFLVALAALPVFAQAPQYNNPRPVERAIENMAPQLAPVQPAPKLPDIRLFGPGMRPLRASPHGPRRLFFSEAPSSIGVCSVPLTNVLKTPPPHAFPNPMPKVKPRKTAPMPLVQLPAPPCPE